MSVLRKASQSRRRLPCLGTKLTDCVPLRAELHTSFKGAEPKHSSGLGPLPIRPARIPALVIAVHSLGHRQHNGQLNDQQPLLMKVSTYESFATLPNDVRQALSYPAQPNFFLSLDWFELLHRTSMKKEVVPRIYVVQGKDDEVLAALYACSEKGQAIRELRSLTNFYAIEFDLSLLCPALAIQGSVRDCLLRHVAQERPSWHLVRFFLMKSQNPPQPGGEWPFGQHRFSAHSFAQYENWHHKTCGESFETYYEQRASQVRNTIKRREKKLIATHRHEIEIVNAPGDRLDVSIKEFVDVYNRSWKQPEPFPDFIPALIRRCADLGILRLGVLRADGVATAAQLWITHSSTAVIYKLAYDERYSQFGVGSILSREMFRHALNVDRVQWIDYGIGSESYKTDWMSAMTKISGVEAFNRRTVIGQGIEALHGAKRKFRALVPRSP